MGGGSSSRAVAASDYESDAAHYMEQNPNRAQVPMRTNTELNLSVLQRYLPSIRSILSIAPNAAVYDFDTENGTWDKTGVEGTMFVCEEEMVAGLPRACVFILNRKGLENHVVDLSKCLACELTPELLIINMEGENRGPPKVLGLWNHDEKDQDKSQINSTMIHGLWKTVKEAKDTAASQPAPVPPQQPEIPAQGAGRSIDINQLFGKK